MIKRAAVLFFVMGLLCGSRLLFAAAGGATAADFLKIPPDAETASMGGSASAFRSLNPLSMFNNPASISGIDRIMLEFSQAAYPSGLYYRQTGFGMPTTYGGSVAVSFGVLNYTGIEAYNSDFTRLDLDDSYDALVTVGFAMKLARKVPVYRETASFGLNVKFIESKLAYYNSEALAVDAGVIYNVPFMDGLTAGLAFKNYGSEIKFVRASSRLPATIGAGLGFKSRQLEGLEAAVDYSAPDSGKAYYSAGLSVSPLYFLKLNAGFKETSDSIFTGFSSGFGLQFGHFKLDYAFLPSRELGPSHFLSLAANIGGIASMESASDFYLEKHFRDAAGMYHKGDYVEARQQFEEILSVYPEHAQSREYLGKIMDRIDKASEARNKKITLYLKKANAALEDKDFITAKRYYNHLVKLNPDNEEARVGIEKLWKAMEEAKLEETRALYSYEIEGLWNNARESYKAGEFVDSKYFLERILKIDPANQDAKRALVELDSQLTKIEAGKISEIFGKGTALYNAGRFREALNYFDAVVLSAPNRMDARELADKCREAVREEDARLEAERIAAEQEMIKPTLDKTYDKALTYYEKGNFESALEYFDKSEEMARKYKFDKYLENTGKYQDIIRATLAERHFKAGFEFFRNNKPEEAADEYKKAIEYNPENRMARNEMEKLNKQLAAKYYEQGMSHFSRSDTEKARQMFERSLEYEPGKIESIKALERIK